MRHLLAVRAAGSLAGAARMLGVSQPALSTSLARLEDELKVKLIARGAGGSALTPVGELIAERAARVVAESDSLVRDIDLVTRGERGYLRIGLVASLRGWFLTPFLLRVARAHPDLDLHIEVTERDALIAALNRRELDLVIVVNRGPADRFATKRIMRVDWVVAASPAHPLASKSDLTLSDLARHRFVGGLTLRLSPENRPAYYSTLNVTFDHLYTVGDLDGMLPLALEGLATILMPGPMAAPYIDRGELVTLDLNIFQPVSFYALMAPAAEASPIVATLIREAQAIGREIVGEAAAD